MLLMQRKYIYKDTRLCSHDQREAKVGLCCRAAEYLNTFCYKVLLMEVNISEIHLDVTLDFMQQNIIKKLEGCSCVRTLYGVNLFLCTQRNF